MPSSTVVRLVLAAHLLAAALAASPALGCTATCLDHGGSCVFGMNLDFPYGGGLVVVNKRGVVKEAKGARTGVPARWTSRYGSVTFDLMGYSSAFTGMNEAGLVGTMQYVVGTDGPTPDARPVIPIPLWLQYQLDTASTVKEVLASDAAVRTESGPSHFLLCDRTGECVSVEFLGGRVVSYTGQALPVKALVGNRTYRDALQAWRGHDRLLDDALIRFKIAADLVTDHARAAARRREVERVRAYQDDAAIVHYSFYVQASVSRQNTAWTVVYDNRNLRVYFTTDRNPHLRQLAFTSLDFSCRTPVRILDVRADLAGDVADALAPYSHAQALAFQWEALQGVWHGTGGFLPPDAPRGDPPTPERAAEILSWFEDLPCAELESRSP